MRRFVCCLAITLLLPACAGDFTKEKREACKAPDAGSISKVRTDEAIQGVFDCNKTALYSIYQRALRNDPTLRGRIVLKLTIAPSGQVMASTVEYSNLKNSNLERQIAARVKLFDFGPSEQELTITYPIDFLPA